MSLDQDLKEKLKAGATPKRTDPNRAFFQDMNGRVVIKRVFTKRTQDPNKQGTEKYLIVELKVLESEAVPDSAKYKTTPNAPGTSCSVRYQINDDHTPRGKAQMNDALAILGAIIGTEDVSDTDDIIERSDTFVGEVGTEDSVRARGQVLAVTTVRRMTQKGQNAGQWNCYPKFHPIDAAGGNSPEAIAKRRKELDAEEAAA